MKLCDICELIVDCPHSTAPDEGIGYPLIRTPNIGKGRLILEGVHRVCKAVYDERNKRAIPQENDLILAREAPIGNVAIVKKEQKVCLGQRTVLIRPNPNVVDPAYLVYYLLSPDVQHSFLGASSGTTVSHLNLSNIRNLEVSVPPISVQKRISRYLSSIDDLIDTNSQVNYNLLQLCLLQYSNLSSQNTPNGYIGDIIVESPKSKIKVGDAKGVSGAYPFFTSGQAILEYETDLVDGRNIYLNTGGNADVKYYIGPASYSTDTWCIHGVNELTDYLYLALLDMKDEIEQTCFDGSTLKHLQKQKLRDKPVYIPSEDDIHILATIKANLDLISHNQRENKKLANLRDALLPKLISGALDVSDVNI